MASYIETKRELLAESLKLLATHEPFIQFMDALKQLREGAVIDACRMDVVENPGKTAAALGEIRCYTDIIALVDESSRKILD